MARDILINDWTKLGSTIRSERTRAGLSQHALSERAGISRSWLAKVEAGHRGAELEQIVKLLDALDLSLILRAGDEPATSSGPPHHADETAAQIENLLLDRAALKNRRTASWSNLPTPYAWEQPLPDDTDD